MITIDLQYLNLSVTPLECSSLRNGKQEIFFVKGRRTVTLVVGVMVKECRPSRPRAGWHAARSEHTEVGRSRGPGWREECVRWAGTGEGERTVNERELEILRVTLPGCMVGHSPAGGRLC